LRKRATARASSRQGVCVKSLGGVFMGEILYIMHLLG
jgi:hypothetical protein